MPRFDLFKPQLVDGRPGIASYRELLSVLAEGRTSRTHADDAAAGSPKGRWLMLRHDVDSNLESALRQARLEAELGLQATFYVLHPGDGPTHNYYGEIVGDHIEHKPGFADALHEIRSLGHEVGLHYDLIQLSNITGRDPRSLLEEELAWFDSIGVPLVGGASHGSALARTHGFLNYEFFSGSHSADVVPRTLEIEGRTWDLPVCSIDDVGWSYEAYRLPREVYVSDSGGRFFISPQHVTKVDLGELAARVADAGRVIALLHPEWWHPMPEATRSPSSGSRRSLPPVESVPEFRRADGRPVRIGARGDCCCRRCVHMNAGLFPDGYEMLVNEKCTNAQYVETLRGRTVSDEQLRELSDVDAMSASLRTYYLGQNDRSVLAMEDLDLLIMDTYSDMNFEVWRLPGDQAPVWIHPKMLRAGSPLAQGLTKVGRATLEDAVADAVRVIDAVREKNPGVPVLFLNQPVEYYSKLKGRRGFYKMGALVAQERFGVYHCDPLDRRVLEVDDMDSSGPGQTLHFTGATYYRMLISAWQRGLADHFDGTTRARDEVAAAGPARPVPLSTTAKLKRTPAGKALRKSVRRGRAAAGAAKRRTRALADRATAPGAPRRLAGKVNRRLRPGSAVAAAAAAKAKAAAAAPPPEPDDVPWTEISFWLGAPGCVQKCADKVERSHKTYLNYFVLDGDVDQGRRRYTPMLLPVEDTLDLEAWETGLKVHSKGAALRQKRKAERLGYVVHPFPWKLHIPDIHDINTSKEIRSGGAMRDNYLRTIEEMGGAPTAPIALEPPACVHHWDLAFGVFLPEPGHLQGSVVTDERLVGYIHLSRTGDLALYSMILGHGEHLPHGVQVLLHHELVRWVGQNLDGAAAGIRYLMYGGKESGGDGLLGWKTRAGFQPFRVRAVDAWPGAGSG